MKRILAFVAIVYLILVAVWATLSLWSCPILTSNVVVGLIVFIVRTTLTVIMFYGAVKGSQWVESRV